MSIFFLRSPATRVRVGMIAAAVSVLSIPMVYTPRYETNDDAGMNCFAAGVLFTDRPDEHLLFTNSVIGLPLKLLYSVMPQVPWYGLYQLSTLALAAAAIACALLRISPTWRQASVLALIVVVILWPCVACMQFTRTAFIAGLAGILLILADKYRLGVVLYTFGSLIRFEAATMALLLAFPLFAVAFARCWRTLWSICTTQVVAGSSHSKSLRSRAAECLRLPGLRQCLSVAGALALSFVLAGLNRAYYAASPEWRGFYDYNSLRAEFSDYHRYEFDEENTDAFTRAGWSPVDVLMIEQFFVADPARFSMEKLQEIRRSVPPRQPPPALETWKSIEGLFAYPWLLASALAAVCGAAIGGWRRALATAAMLGIALAIIFYLGRYFWVPERVVFVLFGGTPALAAALPLGAGGGPLVRVVRGIAIAAGLCGTLCLAHWSAGALREDEAKWVPWRAFLTGVLGKLDLSPRYHYIEWGSTILDVVTPFSDPAPVRSLHCLPLSIITPTPWAARRMEAYGGDVNSLLRAHPEVRLIANPDKISLYQYYCKTHFDDVPQFRLVFRRGSDHFCVFQPVPTASAGKSR